MKQFKTGTTYFMRSICDSECIWKRKVIKRAVKAVTLLDPWDGTTKRCKIKPNRDGAQETCFPLGSYSMAPILTAEKIAS